MIKKYLSFALCCLLLTTAGSAFISAQTRTTDDASTAAKIKAVVVKREKDKNKRVKVKMLDGTKLKGDVSQAGEDLFTLTDSKTRQSRSIAYRDVSQVGRSGLSKGDKIALGVALGAIATAAIVVISYFAAIFNN